VRWILFFILLRPFFSLACLPNEIHIREQWIETYKKEDGTRVNAHLRSEHCREIRGVNFSNYASSKKFRNFNGKLKSWNSSEKMLLNSELEKLPSWLRKYKISSFLRATMHDGNPNNPALSYPYSKTIILFDSFFKSPNKKDILVHELSHIAIWDIDPVVLQNFFISNGWIYKSGESLRLPINLIIPDSSDSPSEDFANSIETYYSNSKRLKEFNSKSFLILEGIIKSKEKQ
jgi:hypothetical protein